MKIKVGNLIALVDSEDSDIVNKRKWYPCFTKGKIYAQSNKKKAFKSALMHRLILNVPFDSNIKHLNGNTLDNRKSNLMLFEEGEKVGYQKEYYSYPRHKRKAWGAVHHAIRDGRLSRKPCEVCKNKNTHAHHQDYEKRLEVKWLCPLHHSREHQKIRGLK